MSSRKAEQWMVGAELREGLEGRKPQDIEAHSHTGMVGDDEIRRLLNHLVTHYDPAIAAEQYDDLDPHQMPDRAEAAKLFRMILRSESTETLTRAIHGQDPLTLSSAVGDPGSRSDISGLRAIDQLIEILAIPAPIIYIYGEPGSGKTNFALLCAQLWKRQFEDGNLISNIRTLDQAEWVPTFGRLKELVDNQTTEIEGGGITAKEDSDPMLFIFDEASSHASGRGKDGHEAGQKLGPMVYKIRKARAGMIIIGHDGKDVHPAVRTLATIVKRYRGEVKKATLFEDVNNRKGINKIMDIDGIPETDYTYDDLEATSWDWTDHTSTADKHEEEIEQRADDRADELADQRIGSWIEDMIELRDMDRSERITFGAQLYQSNSINLSQNKIAQRIDVDQSSISRRVREQSDND